MEVEIQRADLGPCLGDGRGSPVESDLARRIEGAEVAVGRAFQPRAIQIERAGERLVGEVDVEGGCALQVELLRGGTIHRLAIDDAGVMSLAGQMLDDRLGREDSIAVEDRVRFVVRFVVVLPPYSERRIGQGQFCIRRSDIVSLDRGRLSDVR